MKKRVVLALGHKALGTTLPEQKEAVARTAQSIADLVEAGYEVAITHSNAPQVGMIHAAMNEFRKNHPQYTAAPMSVCSAMSQGYIGYDLQNGIREALLSRGIVKTVSTVLSQMLVDPYDEAFYSPSKVVGRYMTSEEAKQEEEKGNFVVKEKDGYRRAVASPSPVKLIELDACRVLLDAGQIVIAAGGGGIPVMEQGHHLRGAAAVIEKDLTASLLADGVNADILIIVTGVGGAFLYFGSPEETLIKAMTPIEADQHIADGHFGEKNMLPKIRACTDFVKKGEGRTAFITSYDRIMDALDETSGTCIKQ